MDEVQELSIETMGGGAAPELFEREMRRMIENVLDPNTDPEKVRKIRIEFSVKPSEDRSRAETSVQVTSKLAPHKPVDRPIYFGENEDGRPVAVGFDPEQRSFFGDPEEHEQVTPIHKEADDAGG